MAAYAQFGYGYPSASQLLVGGGQTTTASAQSPISGTNAPSLSPGAVSPSGVPTGALSPGALSQASNTPSAAPATSSCCENGRPIMTDPVSGQTVCSCQYDSARLALSGYSRIPTGGVGVYGSPYPSTDQNPYPSIGVDSSAFYSPLSNPYGLKESGTASDMSAWTSAGLQPTAGYYPYDPALAAYGYGAGYDLAARRKNATRESTATLKAWLNEHKKNPYPTKGEKIMLAIITKMTLTQVSTWFANARRRLKKENKMTWEPKNKTDDDDDAMVSDDEKDKDDLDVDKSRDHKDSMHHVKSEHCKDDDDDDLTDDDRKPDSLLGHHANMMGHHPYHHHHHHHPAMMHPASGYHHSNIKEEMTGSKNQTSSDCGVPIPATKPKIWSLADTAACKTPPPLHHQQHLQHSQQQQHQQNHQHQQQMHHHQQQNQHQAQHQQQQQQQQQHGAWMTGGGYHSHNQHQMNSGEAMAAMMMGAASAGGVVAHTAMNMNNAAGMNTSNHMHQQNMAMTGAMMNQFGNTPYARYGGFLGGSHHYNTNNNNSTPNTVTGPHQQHPNTPITPTHLQQQNSNGSSNNSTSSINNNTNNNTIAQQTHQQHQQQQHQHPHHHQQQQQQQQTMGFPEVQTDTPPQTPPNMKLPSVAGSLITAAATTPTIGTCYNNNNNTSTTNNNLSQNNSNNTSNSSSNTGYSSSSPVDHHAITAATAGNAASGGGGSNGYVVGNFSARLQQQQHSPQKAQEYTQHMLTSATGGSPQQDGAAFKPFFKSAQMNNGFVSPV